MVRDRQKCVEVFCRFRQFTLNGVISKTILRDRNLLFEGENLKMLISLKQCELAQKMHRTAFKELDICQRMIPLRK